MRSKSENNRNCWCTLLEVPSILTPAYWTIPAKRPRCQFLLPEDIPALPDLVAKMAQLCRDHGGVGLAAPQVGIYKSLAILLTPKGKIQVMINPEIVRSFGAQVTEREGCLSLPGLKPNQHPVVRSEGVEVACGTEEDPFARIVTEHTGFVARLIQHEVDHLNPDGEIFFIDRIGKVGQSVALRRYRNFRKAME